MKSVPFLAFFAVLAMVTWASVDDYLAAQEPDDTPAPVVDANSVFIIVCDAKPNQLLVLDSVGNWVSAVRTVELSLTIGNTTPKVTCTMWPGPLRPTTPTVKVWDLAQLKSVTVEEFQEMVDSLQTDPEAIRRRVMDDE